MNVSLTDEMKDFVQNKVARGDFPSEEAVLQEAVRRFQHEDQLGSRAAVAEIPPSKDQIDYEAIAYCAARWRARTCPRLKRSAGSSQKSPARWPKP